MSVDADTSRREEPRDAPEGLFAELVREARDYGELFYFFAWRDVKIRYKQTVLGVLWVVLQPLATMTIFTVIFGMLAKIPSNGVPYPVFYFCALVPWTYLSTTISAASTSLVSNADLLTKIYFPRIILPAAVALGALVDFAVASCLVGVFIVYYDLPVGWNLLLWPVLTIPLVLLAVGVGTMLAVLNVRYRDLKYVVPFGIQLWFFVTPIVYPSSMVPERYQWLLALNPLAGLIEGFRYSIMPGESAHWDIIGLSLVTALALFVLAVVLFKRNEKAFADFV